ncbi:sulfatase-like hydrolase/transferase [Nocardioides ochotonae]|uniref:sulfatase-like hydrolase/transferase n=1 Tax=Nocardioides ochotonae TaxID=2685869 RepID=UPI00140CCB47|nr:sulfatase-like hydrolase/transferase [Nocardioides ochotonae]
MARDPLDPTTPRSTMYRPRAALATSLSVAVAAVGALSCHASDSTAPSSPRAVVHGAVAAGEFPTTLGTEVLAPTPSGRTSRSTRPNVVMITADDASIDDLRHMPHVRRLVQSRGTRFDGAVAPTPICVPARASLLTGQFAHNHGAETIRGRRGGFRSFADRDTLPAWLQDAGYRTMFVGKYLNGYGSTRNRARTYVPPGWSDWAATVDPSTYSFERFTLNRNGRLQQVRRYSTDALTGLATDLIAKASRQRRSRGTPFYLWLNYVAPHAGGPVESDDPLTRQPRQRDHFTSTVPADRHRNSFRGTSLPDKPNMFERDVSDKRNPATRRPGGWSRLDKELLREQYQQRLEALQAVDEGVARVVRRLRATGQLRRTVLIYASDNGWGVGEHNIVGKHHPYVEQSGIPLLMAGPGIPRGLRSRLLATNPDVAATIAALAGAEPRRRELDGVDVLPWVRLGGNPQRAVPISKRGDPRGNLVYTGVKTGRWTYVRFVRGGEELFDRRRDPYELRSLVRVPRAARVLAEMRRLNRELRDCAGNTCLRSYFGGS